MDITRVDPSLRTATKRAPQVKIENRVVLAIIANLTKFIPGSRTDGVERRVIRDGDVRVRVFIPSSPTGAGLLWIHGGGLVLGAAAMSDQFCGETARDTGTTIVSVEYRVAPKHPFPAALDDVHAGWRWMLQHAAELGLDAARLAVGGPSAGGGLAAYAERLTAAGVEVSFRPVHGAAHGFEAWDSDSAIARSLLADARGWLGERLAG